MPIDTCIEKLDIFLGARGLPKIPIMRYAFSKEVPRLDSFSAYILKISSNINSAKPMLLLLSILKTTRPMLWLMLA
jgi:hypothetical protein